MITTGYKEDSFAIALDQELESIRELLLAKNKAYGDSALNPVRIFSKVDRQEQIKVRIDDKLSRLARGISGEEDVILDLLGYLLIYRISQQGL